MVITDNMNQYFNRMNDSLGDKSRLLKYLVPGSTLEIGFGDGKLLLAAKEMGQTVYAIDSSLESYNRAVENGIDSQDIMCEDVFEAIKKLKGRFEFDNIILCSVLHEIYSYTRNEYYDITSEAFSFCPVEKAEKYAKQKTFLLLAELKNLLRDNGRILIRDGAGVNRSRDYRCSVKMDDEALAFWEEWIKFPFNAESCDNYLEVDTLHGWSDYIYRFMYTYNWGWDSLPREKQESTNAFDINDLVSTFVNGKMRVVMMDSYFLEGYNNDKIKSLEFYSRKTDSRLPDTNMMLVVEK